MSTKGSRDSAFWLSPYVEGSVSPGDILTAGVFYTDDKKIYALYHFSKTKGKWTLLTKLPAEVIFFCTVLAFNRIYFIGGETPSSEHINIKNTVHCYNLLKRNWEVTPSLAHNRSRHCACVLDDIIYVIGGIDQDTNVLDTVECYDGRRKRWKLSGNLCQGRLSAGAIGFDDKLFIAGGFVSAGTGEKLEIKYTSSVECYDKTTGKCFVHSEIFPIRCYCSMINILGRMYLCGGYTWVYGKELSYNGIEQYSKGEWAVASKIQRPRYGAGVFSEGSNIYMVGGSCIQLNEVLRDIEGVNLETKETLTMPHLPLPGTFLSCHLMPNE